MSIERQPVTTVESLMPPDMQAKVEAVREQWQDISVQSVRNATDDAYATAYEPTDVTSRAIVLDPEGEIDEDHSLVLTMPYSNGWSPHLYIRAKVMQQIAAPDSRVIVLPNNTWRQTHYDLSHLHRLEKSNMANGDMSPFAKQQLRTLERIDERAPLGTLALTGFSLGGRLVLSMGAANMMGKLDISHINADETTSQVQRTASELKTDFMEPSNLQNLINFRRSARESNIPALTSLLRMNRMAADLIQFGLASMTADGKLMHGAMTGTARMDCFWAANKASRPHIKIGSIEGSKIFDEDITQGLWKLGPNVRHVQYGGPHFHGHQTADNVFIHALMVRDGISS